MTKAILEKFGDVEVFIPELSNKDEASFEVIGGDRYTSGGGMATLKKVIRSIAEGFSEELRNIKKKLGPDGVELEFSIGFSGEAKAWILGVKGEQKINIKLIWKG